MISLILTKFSFNFHIFTTIYHISNLSTLINISKISMKILKMRLLECFDLWYAGVLIKNLQFSALRALAPKRQELIFERHEYFRKDRPPAASPNQENKGHTSSTAGSLAYFVLWCHTYRSPYVSTQPNLRQIPKIPRPATRHLYPSNHSLPPPFSKTQAPIPKPKQIYKKSKEENMAPSPKSAEFEKAIEDSRKLKTKPTQDELLEVCSTV